MNDSMLPLPGLSPVGGKTVVAKFDGGLLSSDGGILVLREVEQRLRVADRLAACMVDPRAPELITHSLAEIIRFQPVVKLTPEQAQRIHQALRTIPGKVSKADQRTFSALATLVDRAAATGLDLQNKAGLSSAEVTSLKNGLNTLAEKHPKAELQHGLKSLGDALASRRDAVTPATTQRPPVAAVAPSVTPKATVAPAATPAPSTTAKLAVTPAPPAGAAPSTTPKATVVTTAPAVTMQPAARKTEQVHTQELKPQPAGAPKLKQVIVQPVTKPPTVAAHAVAPRPMITAPKPVVISPKPVVAAAAPKPPSPKIPNCTPNIVNGKMMGMTCH